MRKNVKRLSLMLAVVMLLTMSLVGCGGKDDKTANGDTSGASTANEPRITLTMFMCNSGLAHPDGVNPEDNYWINIVEQYANVDLDIDLPAYTDFTTKLNLLLSSGNLPDIVHAIDPTEIFKRAREGAFIELKSYYDKSALVKKYITSEMMEISKDSVSGKYFRIPMAYDKAQQGGTVFARWDLVKKYNDNKWPTSVDEWVALMGKMHKANPDWVVMSNRVRGDTTISYGGNPIYYWYGALPYGSRYEYDTGNVVSTFTLPEYRAATQVMRQLYNDGILDKEFATTDDTKYFNNKGNKNVLLDYNTCDQYGDYTMANSKNDPNQPQAKDFEWLAAPLLTKYPSELKSTIYAQPFKGNPISGHGLYISSKCKTPDRAWKVIEGFASDELWNAVFWGREGTEYTLVNGKKIPNATARADAGYKWTLHLALIAGFTDGQEVKHAAAEALVGKEYCDLVNKQLDAIDTVARKNGISPTNFIVTSDDTNKKLPEARAFISTATVEAIMGRITLEQFDEKVKEFKTTYGFMYDEMTKYVKDHKDEFSKKGVNFNLK